MAPHSPHRTQKPAQLHERLRVRIGRAVFDYGWEGLARLGRIVPIARPHRHGVDVTYDVPYLPSGARDHLLDVYVPTPGDKTERLRFSPPYPVVLYIHGGGFRILSKDTHWLMGLAFARRGMVVMNVNYRLSPHHPFPSALEDIAAAYQFAIDHAAHYGGDPSRIILAGESAGANLALTLALLTCQKRPEPFAKQVFDKGIVPRAVIPMCGMLQVTDWERFSRRKPLGKFLVDRLQETSEAYLGHDHAQHGQSLDLADPLVMLERGIHIERPLPPVFAGVGTADPLLDDSRRLGMALTRLNVPHEIRYYPNEIHAFHAFVFRQAARRCWEDQFAFVDRYL
ncbi:MAG: alpha/beta hydrolase [Polyangia bacterium]|jgi:acetyl esterase